MCREIIKQCPPIQVHSSAHLTLLTYFICLCMQSPTFSFASAPSSGPSPSPLSKTFSTPVFGQTGAQTSSTSFFGSQNNTPNTSAPRFGGSTGFAFQGASTGGAFGTQPSPSTGGGFNFGSATTQPASSFSPGGAFQPSAAQPPNALIPFGRGPQAITGPVDDSAIRELQSIQESYVSAPGNSRFKFQYLFLNVVKDPAARVKPADIDELQWREAMRRAGGPDNSHGLWPVPYNGFNGLLDRKMAQNEAIKEHKERLEALQKSVAALANRHETVVRVQIESIKARHQELSQKLLTTLRHIDVLEGKFSRAVGYDKSTPKDFLQKLDEELRQMESVIASNSAHGLLGRVDSVASAARIQAGSTYGSQTEAAIDSESLSQAYSILKDYSDAIAKMNDAVHRNARDIQVLKDYTSSDR